MRVVGYTYDAAVHCVDCARERFGVVAMYPDIETLDEHNIPYESYDMEGNIVHPIFSTDEVDDDEVCGDCFEKIRE